MGPKHAARSNFSLAKPEATVNSAKSHIHWGTEHPRSHCTAMTQLNTPPDGTKLTQASPEVIPEELAIEIRRMAHDLSNALEIIVQTSYLLSTAELKEPASDWLGMLDSGVNKALDINQSLRSYIKAHAPK